MNIETLLRDTTRARASEVGPPLRRVNDLATVARWRARRRRTRHLLAGAATVVAAVAAATAAVPQLAGPAEDPPLVLAPASYQLPEFPYTPGWLPEGVAEPYVNLWGEVSDRFDREVVVEHAATEGDPHRVLIQLRIISSAEVAGRPGGLPAEDVVVRGAPGVLTSDAGGWLSVTWTDPADRLVLAGAAERQVGRDDLLRYVEELVAEPLPVTPPIDLATVPAGAELTDVAPDGLSFDLPGGRWLDLTVHDPAIVERLHSDLRYSPDYILPPPVTLEVAGRKAELVDIGEGNLALSIDFGSDLMLTISPWSHDHESLLLAFAEGATLNQYARPALLG